MHGRFRPDDDIYVVIESGEMLKQAFHGHTIDTAAHQG